MVTRIREENVGIRLKAAMAALAVGILLVGVKFVAYFLTGSTAIFSDALESIVNVVTGAFALTSVYVAQKPADMEHPYGHGKIEFLSAGFEGAAILGAASLIVYKSINELITRPEIVHLGTGLILVGAAALVNAIMGLYLIRTGKKTGSISLEADGRHLMTDVITSVGVLIAVALIKLTKFYILDPIVALLVAANITWIGIRLIRHSLGGMMDKMDMEADELIRSILDKAELKGKVCGYHRLRSRKSGGFTFVDFHLLMPRDIDIYSAHRIATDVENRVAKALGDAGVMAHIEPCKNKNCPICSARSGDEGKD